MTYNVAELSSVKGISFNDMRAGLAKIEALYDKLRAERADVESRYPSAKDMELATKFTELVGEEFKKCNESGLTYF